MHITCPVSQLQAALSIVTKALAARPSAPILDGVLLETVPEGLHLTCTDLSLGIETLVEATVKEEGRVVLPGKLFSEIIRKQPPGEVDIAIDANQRAVIRCMGARTTLAGLLADEYPALPEVEESASFTLEQQALRDMIQKTCFAIAVDETRPILTGCLLEAEAETLTMAALDGFRLAIRRTTIAPVQSPFQVVIPGKVLSELSKILEATDSPARLTLGDTHVLVDLGATRLTARILEGEFIRYRQILPSEWQTRIEVPATTLADAIDRASLIAREGKNNRVHFDINPQRLLISSQAELGEVREEIEEMHHDGKDLEIAFNVRYISDVLKVLDDELIVMQFQTSISPCVIEPASGNEYLYLVLPVRIYTA